MPAPRSRRSFVAATSLVALAGCLDDSLSDSTDTDETSPARPPGVSDESLDDPEALFSAHEDRLRSEGFEVEIHMQESESEDGQPATDYDLTVRSAPDGHPLRLSGTVERGELTETRDVWHSESQVVTRFNRDDGPRYEMRDAQSDTVADFAHPASCSGRSSRTRSPSTPSMNGLTRPSRPSSRTLRTGLPVPSTTSRRRRSSSTNTG